MITYDDLHQAWLNYRRANGAEAAAKILRQFSADHLEYVPEAKWPELLALLTSDAPQPKSEAPTWESVTKSAYDRWNQGFKRGGHE